eukprot:PITA_16829
MMSRILIVGGTGYLRKYLAKASVSQGYPTFVLVRPATAAALDSSKDKLLQELKDNGIHILTVSDSLFFFGHPGLNSSLLFSNQNYTWDRSHSTVRLYQSIADIKSDGVLCGAAVLNLEDDIAAFTIRVANDSRTMNKLVIYKPPGNVISQSELVSAWERKSGRPLRRVFLPEIETVRLSWTLLHPDNVRISVLQNIFVKGEQTSFELGDEDLEASQLYGHYKYTTVDEFLDTSLISAPETKLTSF